MVDERIPADIEISFEPERHYNVDKYPLDGDNLAHAFSAGSGLGGDVHFLETVQWDFTVSHETPPQGIKRSFFAVALHELGHSLGLDHSMTQPDAVMYDVVHETTGVLKTDDINGIQYIYGIPKVDSTTQSATVKISISKFENS